MRISLRILGFNVENDFDSTLKDMQTREKRTSLMASLSQLTTFGLININEKKRYRCHLSVNWH